MTYRWRPQGPVLESLRSSPGEVKLPRLMIQRLSTSSWPRNYIGLRRKSMVMERRALSDIASTRFVERPLTIGGKVLDILANRLILEYRSRSHCSFAGSSPAFSKPVHRTELLAFKTILGPFCQSHSRTRRQCKVGKWGPNLTTGQSGTMAEQGVVVALT